MRHPTLIRALLAMLVACVCAVPAHAQPVRVAAASDLQFALPALLARFEVERGAAVQVSFGSSGNLARQIRQGAPFELFLSADEAFVEQLVQAGLTRDAGARYATGRIAIIVPRASTLQPDAGLEAVRGGLSSIARFAIANPEHAPYGRAAREALHAAGLWETVRPRLVLGENVSQAAQFVATGAAQAGIVAWSVAIAPELARATRHAVLAPDAHAPLRQRMVLLRSARPSAIALEAFLRSAAAREWLATHGFAPAAED